MYVVCHVDLCILRQEKMGLCASSIENLLIYIWRASFANLTTYRQKVELAVETDLLEKANKMLREEATKLRT